MKKALLFSGGWDGHQPEVVGSRIAEALREHSVETEHVFSLDRLDEAKALSAFDVIIPNWTMGQISDQRLRNLLEAVREGVGLAGIHGGAGDAFRGQVEYEWMVGGHFVGHPHVGPYDVRRTTRTSPITEHLPSRFAYDSEQYYLLVDPGIEVLADTIYRFEDRECVMPVAWTKFWGRGRVFYSALGHNPAEFDRFPDAWQLTLRGILWATGIL